MRPGQAAPVFNPLARKRQRRAAASMRPGQAAPVFLVLPGLQRRLGPASMRPGQAAPVFRFQTPRGGTDSGGFNEAGAGCPGIQDLSR